MRILFPCKRTVNVISMMMVEKPLESNGYLKFHSCDEVLFFHNVYKECTNHEKAIKKEM